ncbi:MAG: isopentenyl-diphosphate delta-isomerase [Syntrophus sp. (in: bacteria)]|nr:isopentenyl-diphosphate delta-isomerase [Syntrophus sp. (in: bacteria)]
MADLLILVDKDDNPVGSGEKTQCHLIPAPLHRAFSIFIVNSKGEILIHKRSALKKTWPGFWTNACCSHPRAGESLEIATERRLQEELGFTAPLQYLFTFKYEAEYDQEYGEKEIDHVFLGLYDGRITHDPDEIDDWRFVEADELKTDIETCPEIYTPWFKLAMPLVMNHLNNPG